jgi:hypothetical protein
MSLLASLRSVRVADIAVFDVVASVLALGWANERWGTGSFADGALAAVPIGVLAHAIVGQPTQLNFLLGLSGPPVR